MDFTSERVYNQPPTEHQALDFAEGETICVEGAHDAVLKERDMEVDAWQQGSSGGPVRLSFRRAMGKLDHVRLQNCRQL